MITEDQPNPADVYYTLNLDCSSQNYLHFKKKQFSPLCRGILGKYNYIVFLKFENISILKKDPGFSSVETLHLRKLNG